MKTLLNHIRGILLGLGIIALTGLAACGGGAGGSNAAPSGGTESPVAVEIPAVNSVSDVVYISAPVVGVVGGDLSAKSASPAKFLTDAIHGDGSTYTGSSLNACQTANVTRGILKDASHPDLGLCILINEVPAAIQPYLTANNLTADQIYDGRNIDGKIWVQKSASVELAKARFNITRDSSGFVSQFTTYACACADSQCSSSVQTTYMRESFTSTGGVTIESKNIEGDYSSTMAVTGILDTNAQYTSKTITESSRNLYESSITQTQSAIMTQDTTTTATIDGFQRVVGSGTTDIRIYSNFDFSYTGDPTADLDLAKYDIGAGAGRLIYDILDQVECWGTTGDLASFPCVPHSDAISGVTPMAVTDIAAASFVGDEIIDCSTIGTNFTIGTETAPYSIETSACSGFKDLESHMECFADINDTFVVTPSYNGTTLSENANAPTLVSSTNPTLVLTTNYPALLMTFNSSNLQIRNYPSGNTLVGPTGIDNWTNNYTTLTLTYGPLATNYRYSLTISDQQGLDGSHVAGEKIYYIKTP